MDKITALRYLLILIIVIYVITISGVDVETLKNTETNNEKCLVINEEKKSSCVSKPCTMTFNKSSNRRWCMSNKYECYM